MATIQFTDKDGKVLVGRVTYAYSAFEGGMRYVVLVGNKEYRCIKDADGKFLEYVA